MGALSIVNMTCDIDASDLEHFEAVCEVAIRNVGTGAKYATEAACKEILEQSSIEVPKDTWTMASSGFYEVRRRSDVKGHSYEGIIAYGGNGDPTNPKSGKRASSYMVALHEDLSKPHANGKAKFLEDPVRAYYEGKWWQTIFDYASASLAGM